MNQAVCDLQKSAPELADVISADASIASDSLIHYRDREVPIVDGIAKFTGDDSYSTGNFSRLRQQYPKLQLDSCNGTDARQQTILDRTGWSPESFHGKLVLECGCGAGPDTEVLLSLGANVVAVDISSVSVAKENLNNPANALFIQASIDDLPLRQRQFDIVFCHRVLQHTPSPQKTLEHILNFVKPGGRVFVHSYARTWQQMISWKYAMRPLTCRLRPERLYRLVRYFTPSLFRLTCAMRRCPPEILGRILFRLAYHAIPIRNYRFDSRYASLDDDAMIEYAIHDTFDALSPKYDSPISADEMSAIASGSLDSEFELVRRGGVTLLRSIITSACDETLLKFRS